MKKILFLISCLGVLVGGVASAKLWDYYDTNLPTVKDRIPSAESCGISNYTGTAIQNIALEKCLTSQITMGGSVIFPNQGGTGTSTKPSLGSILLGNSSGTYDVVPTSSLNIITTEHDPIWSAVSTSLTTANFGSPNISQWTNNSGYITSSALAPYLLTSTAASTYVPLLATSTWNTAYGWGNWKTELSSTLPISYDSSTGIIGWVNPGYITTSASGMNTSSVLGLFGATLPLTYTTTTNSGVFAMPVASSTQNGYLSSGDWSTFNNKVSSQWITSGANIYYSAGSVAIGTTPMAGAKLNISTNNIQDAVYSEQTNSQQGTSKSNIVTRSSNTALGISTYMTGFDDSGTNNGELQDYIGGQLGFYNQSGTTTNRYGLKIPNAIKSLGTVITNNYGLYVAAQVDTDGWEGGTNNYAIWSGGPNYLAGTTTLGIVSAGTWSATVIGSAYGGTGTSTYTWPTIPGGASTVLTNDGSGNLSWAAAGGGGDTTLATQRVWTDAFSATAITSSTVTTTLATQATASTTGAGLERKLLQWQDAGSVTRYGWIKSVSQSGAVLTLTVNGYPFYGGSTNFRVSRSLTVQNYHWYIPGQCVADATNPVGVEYSVPTTSLYFLSLDGLLNQPNTSTLTVNIYTSSTYGGTAVASIFATAPDFGANGYTLENQIPTTSTFSGKGMITLRTPACGSGGNGSDMDLWLYYMPVSWQTF